MSNPSPSLPPAPPAVPSASEQRLSARLGAWLFRNRSWLPVPFLVVTIVAASQFNVVLRFLGGLLVAAGEGIRLAGVAAAGTVTRRRSRDVQRLVTYGVFRWVRNPLYVGNFLIWSGFVLISGVLWFLPIAIAIFAIEYTLIVSYEEGVLESIFGREYLDYKETTSRWIPRRPSQPESGPHDWREAWRSEISTFLQYAALLVVFGLRQKVWWD
jgi:protein-S-isoprenylcysteine O-methyltransferase Ste14